MGGVSALLRREVVDCDSPADPADLLTAKSALLRQPFALGLGMCPNSRVVVGDDGRPVPAAVPMRLRFARSVRISMEATPLLPRAARHPLRRRRRRPPQIITPERGSR
jgi:hypothetical protein